ncbi:GPALPP motifs-containing protein 1 [Exaiptasia diaphana]|uniref:DUF3752 domain-containing protein n=1 Tax=Exaiptasia diaphana TaxID=2652724 RepID=A0A913WZG3_EXADI|nr:GPALPP motifs-containing protein 1 [Exaiptasia diaphana]KXJ16563.1 GPALPP motifs-containing protein 1 [Exaiptasia diaphana]
MEIGPSLPPHLLKKNKEELNSSTIHEERVQIGPCLPPNLSTHDNDQVEKGYEQEEDDCTYGPALPPHLANTSKSSGVVGPSLPIDPRQSKKEENIDEETGPVIGPMPSSSSTAQHYSSIERDIEARSNAMKDKLTGKNKVKQKREEWMTELPPEIGKNFGLGARKFRKQAVDCGDRSVWTDTPSDRSKKQEREARKRTAEESKAPWEEEKERNMNDMIQSYTKQHRGESLMEIHQRELSKKRKEEGIKPNERRPFDRDRDLGYTTVDPDKRKSLISKSKELETRFHRSKSGSTFL